MPCTTHITCSAGTTLMTCKPLVSLTEQQRQQQRGLAQMSDSEIENGSQLTPYWLVAGAGGAVQILCRGAEVGQAQGLRAILCPGGTGKPSFLCLQTNRSFWPPEEMSRCTICPSIVMKSVHLLHAPACRISLSSGARKAPLTLPRPSQSSSSSQPLAHLWVRLAIIVCPICHNLKAALPC